MTSFAQTYGENGLLLDNTSLKITATIKCDGFAVKITTPVGGRFIVTVSNRNNARIWDMKLGKEIFKVGQDKEVAADQPAISNAMFDGERTLVYTVDNSWGKGKVIVHDIAANKELARFDARNGHVVMDVDFTRGRIALTGTERSLTVTDLTGRVIVSKEARHVPGKYGGRVLSQRRTNRGRRLGQVGASRCAAE